MKSVYSLHCTICNNNWDGRSSWLKHLIGLDHQSKAREKCVNSWFVGEDKDVMQSLVVIFSSFSLNQLIMLENLFERLIEIEGSGYGFNWISDFVWWPERDRVGYLQFESRKVVTKLFEKLTGPNLQVENKLVQLKRSVDIPSLEFSALLPREIANEIFLGRDMMMMTSDTTTTTTTNHPPPSSLIPLSSYIPNAKTNLQSQFNSICISTEFPNDQFNQVLKISQTLLNLFRERQPDTQLVLLRNFYLRLKNCGSKTLIFFVYIPDDSQSSGFLPMDDTLAELIIESSQFKERFANYVRQPHRSCLDGGKSFFSESSKLQFTLITYPLHIVEAHLNLLIKYLCSFDCHLKPVLLLVHYWATTNCVQIGDKSVPFTSHHTILPEPSALEWMVILFLAREGVIPRVRQIVERKHSVRLAGVHQDDCGFFRDEDYATEWEKRKGRGHMGEVDTDAFILEVVDLAGRFFEFYGGNLERGCWVLNPKDGEILKREGTRISRGGLSQEEVTSLMDVQNSEGLRKHKMEISKLRIYVLNPLHLTWRLSFCVDTWTRSTCGKMKMTGRRLGEYLSEVKNGKGSGKSLEAALKV